MDLSQIFTAAAVAIPSAVLLFSSIYKVDQQTESVITSFGKYVKTQKDPGLHVKLPFPFQSVFTNVSTAIQQEESKLENTKTSDDLFVTVPVTVQFEISDANKYVFKGGDEPEAQMMALVDAAIRKHYAGKDFQAMYSGNSAEISAEVIEDIGESVAEYGLTIRRIVIDQPQASEEVRAKYESVRTSRMSADAAKNTGEADYTLAVKKAEAERQRDLLRGEGAAGYRKEIFAQYSEQINDLVKEGTPREEAVKVMMGIMYMDTLREVGEKGNMVIVTNGADNDEGMAKLMAAIRASGAQKRQQPPQQPRQQM